MPRKKTTPIPTHTVTYDTDAIMSVLMKVKAEGFVPVADLRAAFGDDKVTQAIAILYRDYRMFREVRRPWKDDQDVLGYEWADKRFSTKEAKSIPQELIFIKDLATKHSPRYGDYQEVTAHCVFNTDVLGGIPVKRDEHGDEVMSFDRANGDALILRYHQRAMATNALPLIGKQQALARRIGWSTIRIPIDDDPAIEARPVIVQNAQPGGAGKGLKLSEVLKAGTEFTIKALVPTSELKVDEFIRLLRIGGEFVGLSPGRSAGFGNFEVLSAE